MGVGHTLTCLLSTGSDYAYFLMPNKHCAHPHLCVYSARGGRRQSDGQVKIERAKRSHQTPTRYCWVDISPPRTARCSVSDLRRGMAAPPSAGQALVALSQWVQSASRGIRPRASTLWSNPKSSHHAMLRQIHVHSAWCSNHRMTRSLRWHSLCKRRGNRNEE
jgi:hypothetical protein